MGAGCGSILHIPEVMSGDAYVSIEADLPMFRCELGKGLMPVLGSE